MKLPFVAALAAWLITAPPPAVAQIGDIEALRFTAVPRMPDGPPIQVRATPALRFEVGAVGSGVATYAFGSTKVEQIEPDRFRATWLVTRYRLQTPDGSIDAPMPNVTLGRFDSDASGKPIRIERSWQDLPVVSPSPQITRESWSALRTRLLDYAKDWVRVLDAYDDTPIYTKDLSVGSPIGPSNLAGLFAEKLEYLEAMVRGNTAGFWGDLPQGNLTAARKDLLAGVIRSRGMPTAYESDVRIRGTTTHGGRSFVLASGTIRMTPKSGPAVEGTTDMLIDPATGVVALYRKRLTYRGTNRSESQYVKVEVQ